MSLKKIQKLEAKLIALKKIEKEKNQKKLAKTTPIAKPVVVSEEKRVESKVKLS
jgi:hypothetical protein